MKTIFCVRGWFFFYFRKRGGLGLIYFNGITQLGLNGLLPISLIVFPMYFVWQPGFGYQQHLVPGMRPGGAPMPNFFVPIVPQGQQAQRPGGRRTGAGPVQQNQQPVPMLQQQVCDKSCLDKLISHLCLQ